MDIVSNVYQREVCNVVIEDFDDKVDMTLTPTNSGVEVKTTWSEHHFTELELTALIVGLYRLDMLPTVLQNLFEDDVDE